MDSGLTLGVGLVRKWFTQTSCRAPRIAFVVADSASYALLKMDGEAMVISEEVALAPQYTYRFRWSGLAVLIAALALGGLMYRTLGKVVAEWFVINVVISAPAVLISGISVAGPIR